MLPTSSWPTHAAVANRTAAHMATVSNRPLANIANVGVARQTARRIVTPTLKAVRIAAAA